MHNKNRGVGRRENAESLSRGGRLGPRALRGNGAQETDSSDEPYDWAMLEVHHRAMAKAAAHAKRPFIGMSRRGTLFSDMGGSKNILASGGKRNQSLHSFARMYGATK